MDNRLTVKALAAMMGENIQQLAEHSGISYNHLRLVSCGDVPISGIDMYKLAKYCNVSMDNINPFNLKATHDD